MNNLNEIKEFRIMKNLFLKLLVIICVVLVAQSCKTRMTDFTLISTQNVPLENITLKKAQQRVEGKDSAPIILWIPGIPNLKEAIDKAIRKYPGAVALSDGVVYSASWTCLLFGQTSYIVEGTPVYVDDNRQENYNRGSNNSVSNESVQNVQEQQRNNFMRITHVVEGEKNIAELAKMYEVSISDLLKWNKLSSTNITKGQKIIVYLQM